MRKPLPPIEYLHECLRYDPDSGVLFWRLRPLGHFADRRIHQIWNTRFAGKNAGRLDRTRRLTITLNSHQWHVGPIIWKLMTGHNPEGDVDHVDCDHRNNKWLNLRDGTHRQNCQNRKTRNISGRKGVRFEPKTGRYQARIYINGKHRNLGMFASAAEAHDAYCYAGRKAFGSFFRSD